MAGGVHPQLGGSPQKRVVSGAYPGLNRCIPVVFDPFSRTLVIGLEGRLDVACLVSGAAEAKITEYKNITITARSKKEVDIILVGARSQA
ncbi:hypothetical protein CROQUDRAFT_665905, partial [Cronartium quercuum f. sp. fusiforme G11]